MAKAIKKKMLMVGFSSQQLDDISRSGAFSEKWVSEETFMTAVVQAIEDVKEAIVHNWGPMDEFEVRISSGFESQDVEVWARGKRWETDEQFEKRKKMTLNRMVGAQKRAKRQKQQKEEEERAMLAELKEKYEK